MALSYASPTAHIEGAIPASRQRWPKAKLVYCEPWSERRTRPGAGARRASAMSRALVTISVSRPRRIAQPTTRRGQASEDDGEIEEAFVGPDIALRCGCTPHNLRVSTKAGPWSTFTRLS